jgi:ABC-2 type transport system permease protein
MMADLVTVLRKELFDLFVERSSFRSITLQTLILIVLTGVVVPSLGPPGAPMPLGQVVTLYVFFPAVLATSISADAFAGERERKTLETLLATPLADSTILFGKALAAVAYATAVALMSVGASQLTAWSRHAPALLLRPESLVGIAGGAVGAALLTTSITIMISLWVPVVRSVQQMAVIVSMALVFGASKAMLALGWSLRPVSALGADAVLLSVALAALLIARLLFRRDRFFEKR